MEHLNRAFHDLCPILFTERPSLICMGQMMGQQAKRLCIIMLARPSTLQEVHKPFHDQLRMLQPLGRPPIDWIDMGVDLNHPLCSHRLSPRAARRQRHIAKLRQFWIEAFGKSVPRWHEHRLYSVAHQIPQALQRILCLDTAVFQIPRLAKFAPVLAFWLVVCMRPAVNNRNKQRPFCNIICQCWRRFSWDDGQMYRNLILFRQGI